ASIYRSHAATPLTRVAVWLVVGAIVVSTLDGLVHVLTGKNLLREWLGASVDDYGGIRRATGLLRNPIPFGHSMGAFFWISAAGLLAALTQRRWNWAWVSAALCLVSLFSVLLSQTRGAWLAIALVSVLSVPVLKGGVKRFWMSCLGVACLIGLVALLVSPELRSRLKSGFDPSEQSNQVRLELWQANLEILKDHPFGIGYNANDQLIGETFKELGFEDHPWMGHSHNEFIEIAVGSGWLGIGLYMALTLWILGNSVIRFRHIQFSTHPWMAFLLLSSILIQLFVNACAMTDQLSNPGRFLLCFAWAIAIVVPVERRSASTKDSSE
ncbi:MAG: O-antigen ligase family protein, partial [Verrucomicrobiota bacterium]